jgi:hypothetical protein
MRPPGEWKNPTLFAQAACQQKSLAGLRQSIGAAGDFLPKNPDFG